MISMVCSGLGQTFELIENKVNVLVLENPIAFRQFICELQQYINKSDCNITFYKKHEDVKYSNKIDLTTDIMSLTANNAKVLKALQAKLCKFAENENFFVKTSEVFSVLNEYIIAITNELDVVLDFDDLEPESLFKAVSPKLDSNPANVLERLNDYISLMNEFCKIELFFFVNLKAFLTAKEMQSLYKTANYKKIQLFLIETAEQEPLDGEKITVFDNDLCRIK